MLKNEVKQRFYELDSLRGIAAIGIVLWHFLAQFNAIPFFYIFFPFYTGGIYLVDFFFLLSGFILAYTYLDKEIKTKLSNLLLIRIVRLYPLHFITLLIVLIQLFILSKYTDPFQYLYEFSNVKHFFLNLFLLNGVGFEDGHSFNGPAWAISSLFFVNTLFFIVIAKIKNKNVFFLLLFFIPLLIILFTTRDLLVEQEIPFISDGILRTMLDFFAGVILFIFINRKKSPTYLSTSSKKYDLLFTFTSIFLIMFMVGSLRGVTGIDIIIACIVFPTILISSIKSSVVKDVLSTKPLVYMGKISFSIYLVHFPVQMLFRIIENVFDFKFDYGSSIFFLLIMLTTIILADIAYRLVEVPSSRLIKRLKKI